MENLDRIKTIIRYSGIAADVKMIDDAETELYEIDGCELTFDDSTKIWEVGYWQQVSGGHWEPDDVDYIKCGESPSLVNAMKIVLECLIDNRLTDVGYEIYPMSEDEF